MSIFNSKFTIIISSIFLTSQTSWKFFIIHHPSRSIFSSIYTQKLIVLSSTHLILNAPLYSLLAKAYNFFLSSKEGNKNIFNVFLITDAKDISNRGYSPWKTFKKVLRQMLKKECMVSLIFMTSIRECPFWAHFWKGDTMCWCNNHKI